VIRRGTVISIGGFTKNFGTGCPGVFGASSTIVSGGWPGLKIGTKDKPHPFSSFWGSTWALLGLSHSLPALNPLGNQAHVGG
jgi:hypothetical protein